MALLQLFVSGWIRTLVDQSPEQSETEWLMHRCRKI